MVALRKTIRLISPIRRMVQNKNPAVSASAVAVLAPVYVKFAHFCPKGAGVNAKAHGCAVRAVNAAGDGPWSSVGTVKVTS